MLRKGTKIIFNGKNPGWCKADARTSWTYIPANTEWTIIGFGIGVDLARGLRYYIVNGNHYMYEDQFTIKMKLKRRKL